MTHNKFFSKFIVVVALSMGSASYADDGSSGVSSSGSGAKESSLTARNVGLGALGLVAAALLVVAGKKAYAKIQERRGVKAADLSQQTQESAQPNAKKNAQTSTRRASFFGTGN